MRSNTYSAMLRSFRLHAKRHARFSPSMAASVGTESSAAWPRSNAARYKCKASIWLPCATAAAARDRYSPTELSRSSFWLGILFILLSSIDPTPFR